MMDMVPYLPYAWPATAVVSLCVGLAALGYNVLKILQLNNLRQPFGILAGLAGLVSMVAWVYARHEGVVFPGHEKLASATWFITALVALRVGLSATHLDQLISKSISKKVELPLQYVAGVVGAYSLIAYAGLIK